MATREYRVLIADDEPAARLGVRQLLRGWPAWKVVAECGDGHEVLASIDVHRPDVLFLDIQMPGIDGFEVLRRRSPEPMPAVVFLTAYEEFALQGFDAQAIDYLVKPVTEVRFGRSMQRLTRFLAGESRERDPGLLVATTRGVTRLELEDIDWVESADNYVRIWSGGRSFLHRDSLQRLGERLETLGFCRAHRKALVRVSAIRRLQRTGDEAWEAVLRSGVTIPISRRQRGAVMEKLGKDEKGEKIEERGERDARKDG